MTGPVPAYDDLPDGVLVADETGTVISVNRAAVRLIGRSADEALGQDYRKVLPLVDPTGRDWWACTQPYDGLATRTGQPERQLTLTADDHAGPALLVTARYVREAGRVRRLVVCLRQAAERDRLERSRADLISTVAHELRSPLTSVKGFTATLLAKWDRFGDEAKKAMLQTVNADADRVTRLLADLLDVSRIDAGRLQVYRRVVDVPDAVRRAFAGLVAAGQPEDRFELRVAGEPPEMWLDRDKLDQILGNLLDNAVKYGDGVVTVTVEATESGVAVTVADQGEGVPEEALRRVFTKFWRRPDGGRRTGTGLGLYITKGLVEAHGGEITAGRAAGGGASFRFTLPAGTPSFEA